MEGNMLLSFVVSKIIELDYDSLEDIINHNE